MINKYFLFFLLFPAFCFGELFLEITKGSEDPFRVALIPLKESDNFSKKINKIIVNDLTRTGEFYILDEDLLLSLETTEEDINYSDWKLLGVDYVVSIYTVKINNSIDLKYEIYDVYNKKK